MNAAHDPGDEALTLDGEGGWECRYSKYEASSKGTQADWDAILSLYNSEWKPAYECVYNNSPYLVSAAEMIAGLNKTGDWTVADLCDTNNKETIFAGSTNGISNELLSFYDDNYELYYYSPAPGKKCFVKLADVDANLEHNVVSTLYAQGYLATQAPTTAELIAARRARFIATVSHYWDKDQLIFHYAFCIYFGVSDNFAKNSYPFKFFPLSGATSDTDYANRWGWDQDDVDTSFLTDNRGQQTKKYSVDHGDKVNGTEIFQGGDSALWVMVRDYFQTDIQAMMARIASAAVTLASRFGVSGRNTNDTMLRIVSYYCWDHSAKYFSAMLYEEDRSWAYLPPWILNPDALYNDTAPLTQALGDQYRAEKSWMKKRIEFLFSRYRVGTYASDENETQFAPTLAANSPFTFQIIPAIDMYPVIWAGVSSFTQAVLTRAGNPVSLTVVSSGATNLYVKGLNWISSLGDMRGLVLTSRGGDSDDIPFSISGQRLREVKVGDADVNLVDFNATSFAASGPSLKTVDGRNTTTVRGAIVLDNCPRLVSALFEGSGASGLTIPVAARVTAVSFPTNAHDVFLHSLFRLQTSGLTLPSLAGIETLYINNCDGLNPLAIVSEILATNGNHLSYVTLVFKTVTLTSLDVLVKMLDLSGYLDYDGNSVRSVSGLPHIEGTIDISGCASAVLPVWLEHTDPEAYGNAGLSRMRITNFGTSLYLVYNHATLRIMHFLKDSAGKYLKDSDGKYLTA